jgi:hypothetical protein
MLSQYAHGVIIESLPDGRRLTFLDTGDRCPEALDPSSGRRGGQDYRAALRERERSTWRYGDGRCSNVWQVAKRRRWRCRYEKRTIGLKIVSFSPPNLLKLRSDQTNSVSVDLHQQRLNGDGRLLSFGHTCGRLRRRKIKKPPFRDPETPAAVGQKRNY